MSSISIFDIFKIGIGPSSSHTVGPMKAAREFVNQLAASSAGVHKIEVRLYGSLAFTGKGHGTETIDEAADHEEFLSSPAHDEV